jgi:hypothetical protein
VTAGFDETSHHELVSRYTALLEALFEERGGRGAGLMQKAERFNYALSERDWDQLCWINSEGREVACYDPKRFQEIANGVIAAVEKFPRQPAASARSSRDDRASAHAKTLNRRPPHAKNRGFGWGKLLVLGALVGAVWIGYREIGEFAQRLVESVAADRKPNPLPLPPTAPELTESAPAPSVSAHSKRSKKVKNPRSARPKTNSAHPADSAGAEAVHKEISSLAETANESPPASPRPEQAESAAPRNEPDPGKIRMTPRELDSF